MNRPRLALRGLRRAVLARRRLLAAACAAVAVAAGLAAHSPAPPPRTWVVAAAHDLAAGVVLRPADLHPVALDPDVAPDGATSEPAGVVGRTTAGPVRAGEPVTDVRLVAPGLLDGYPGLVALPVRIGDPGAVALLRVGDRVDLLATDPQERAPSRVVGRAVPVLALPREGDRSTGLTTGALVVLGVTAAAAPSVTAASVTAYLSVIVTR